MRDLENRCCPVCLDLRGLLRYKLFGKNSIIFNKNPSSRHDNNDRSATTIERKERKDIFVGGRTLPAVSSSRVVRVTHNGYSTGNFSNGKTAFDTNEVHAIYSMFPC